MKRSGVGILALLIVGVWVGYGHATDLAPFIHDLKTGDEPTRIRAVVALGHSGDPDAVGILQDAAHDDSQLVRQYAIQALADLLQLLEHTSRLVAHWLYDLRARLAPQLEEPQTTAVSHPSVTRMGASATRFSAAWSSKP